jgi:hypothetical protein
MVEMSTVVKLPSTSQRRSRKAEQEEEAAEVAGNPNKSDPGIKLQDI